METIITTYNQFNDIKEIGNGGFSAVYSAIWKDGPLNYDTNNKKYIRESKELDNKVVKCLFNSKNITISLNEV